MTTLSLETASLEDLSQDELLASVLEEFSASTDTDTDTATTTTSRSPSSRDDRRQFTLAALPIGTIYLQGSPTHLPLALLDATTIHERLAILYPLGVIRSRHLPNTDLSPAKRKAILETYLLLISQGKAFTPDWLSTLKATLTDCPSILATTTLLTVQERFLSATNASASFDQWLATRPPLPTTTPPTPPALSLDDLIIC